MKGGPTGGRQVYAQLRNIENRRCDEKKCLRIDDSTQRARHRQAIAPRRGMYFMLVRNLHKHDGIGVVLYSCCDSRVKISQSLAVLAEELGHGFRRSGAAIFVAPLD